MSALKRQSIYTRPNEAVWVPDVAYRTGVSWRGETLVLDYDLSQLHIAPSPRWQCGELEDLNAPAARILIQVGQHDAAEQLKADIFASTRKIESNGELRVVVPPLSRSRRIGELLRQGYTVVKRHKAPDRHTLFICRQPVPTPYSWTMTEIRFPDPVSGRNLLFYSRPGIFSASELDAGTHLLLRNMGDVSHRSVLDVGAGYGPIGIVAAVRGAKATMIDDDIRALKMAQRNTVTNNVTATALLKDSLTEFADNAFDLVLSNPPTHAGSQTLIAMFQDMRRICREAVYLVIKQQLNYEKWLSHLGQVSAIEVFGGYKVLKIA